MTLSEWQLGKAERRKWQGARGVGVGLGVSLGRDGRRWVGDGECAGKVLYML